MLKKYDKGCGQNSVDIKSSVWICEHGNDYHGDDKKRRIP
jgi:hypothetical protein